jgi:hypothetical protein
MRLSDQYETVYAVLDYWDTPRQGVADCRGEPHFFSGLFSEELDEWTDNFELSPIDAVTFEMVRENWEMWLRFRAALDAGHISQEWQSKHWGALPNDVVRHDELQVHLASAMKIDRLRCDVRRA